ncbi:hypothetical protein RJ639_031942 [Escallonia herrerae]|uniref:Receptor-like serine/threonine-protein kinase n=1 Tax=Escallonia herrerae TaxID=1293975 RepID=A0AA88X5U6_9ASTE|nr:hypothetical protein RJ639_031942 [Escallonia herrerae]
MINQTLVFLLVISSSCFHFATSKVRTSLPRGSALSVEDDSDLITSQDNTFTCGFYGMGTNAYWFAIWFTNSKDRTIAWTANRDKPVNGKGSSISLKPNGAMVLTDANGLMVWMTNTTSADVDRAELLNTGNLVLKDPKGRILWQSFDSPTDTLLPSQIFTKSKSLVSALRKGSYQSGYFSLFFNSDNVLKMIYDGPEASSVYWPRPDYDVWGNLRTNYNSSRIASFDDQGVLSSSDKLQFSASDMGFGIKRRLTLDYDGNLRFHSLNFTTGLWSITWEAFAQQCNVHGLCGRYGICIYTPQAMCSCPPGYEVSDISDWSKGCKPTFNFTCSKSQQLKFVEILHTDYYGFDSNYSRGISFEDCRKICLDDCACQAFSYRLDGVGLCYAKIALFSGLKTLNFPGSIYMKLPTSVKTAEPPILVGYNTSCESNKSLILLGSPSMYETIIKRVRWVYLYSFCLAIGTIESLIFLSSWWFLFRRSSVPATLEDGYRVISSHFRRFSYAELKKATKNFKVELGRGSSGAVYKGVLADARIVAVKRLGDAFQGEQEFCYGIVILEIVRGIRLSTRVIEDTEEHEVELTRLVGLVKLRIQSKEECWMEDIVDPKLNGQFDRKQAATLLEIGLACMEEDRSKRPTMDTVVQILLESEAEQY